MKYLLPLLLLISLNSFSQQKDTASAHKINNAGKLIMKAQDEKFFSVGFVIFGSAAMISSAAIKKEKLQPVFLWIGMGFNVVGLGLQVDSWLNMKKAGRELYLVSNGNGLGLKLKF